MFLFSTIAWKLTPGKKKLEKLRERGLVIGRGCEILNGYEFGSEPYLVEIGDNVRITRGVNITTHDGGVWVLRHLYPELSDVDRFARGGLATIAISASMQRLCLALLSARTALSARAQWSLTISLITP